MQQCEFREVGNAISIQRVDRLHQGEPVLLENAAGPQLQAGDNTVLCDDGARCAADIYGYAGLLDGKPAVLPPLWVSPDHMQALFICLPAPSPPPAPPEQ